MQAIKAHVVFLYTLIDMHTYDTLSCSHPSSASLQGVYKGNEDNISYATQYAIQGKHMTDD